MIPRVLIAQLHARICDRARKRQFGKIYIIVHEDLTTFASNEGGNKLIEGQNMETAKMSCFVV